MPVFQITKVDTLTVILPAEISSFGLFGKYQKHWQLWATEQHKRQMWINVYLLINYVFLLVWNTLDCIKNLLQVEAQESYFFQKVIKFVTLDDD